MTSPAAPPKRKRPGDVPAGPARAHIEQLVNEGAAYQAIGRVVGVSIDTVRDIVIPRVKNRKHGVAQRTEFLRPELERRLLAVTLDQVFESQGRVPAWRAADIVKELRAAGVPGAFIKRRIGYRKSSGDPSFLRDKSNSVTQATFDSLWQLYTEFLRGELSDTVNIGHGRTRTTRFTAPKMVTRDPILKLVDVLEERIDQNHWRRHAVCAIEQVPVGVFFPSRGSTGDEARQICGRCPVREHCLTDLMSLDESTLGGLSKFQRRIETRERSQGAAA